jgi:hypothetical protein
VNKVVAITVAVQLDFICFVVKIRYMSDLWKTKFYRKVCRFITNRELRKSCLAVDIKGGGGSLELGILSKWIKQMCLRKSSNSSQKLAGNWEGPE